MRYTSLTTTISHENNNHRTSIHASTSWRSDGSPSCLGGSSHGWVPVNTHSIPVPTSVGRLWVACSLALQHTTMSPRKRNTTTTWQRSECYAISRCAEQCGAMECADVPDVVRSDDLSNVASRAEALRQCKLGFSTDKMVGDNKVLTARCRWYETA